MAHALDDRPATEALGKELRRLRERRRLSQESLAQQLNTDKAQISKRERGKHLPRRDTLQRYAEVLQLDDSERRKLFELAGYAVGPSPIKPDDFTRMVEAVRDEWLARPWPAAFVLDLHWTLWHANESFASLFSSGAATNLTGRHVLELYFDPAVGMREALRRVTDDAEIDRFIAHMVERFRIELSGSLSEQWWKHLEDRLRTFDRFAQVWDGGRRTRGAGSVTRLAYLNLRAGGRLIMVGVPAKSDERFILTLILPADARSADLLERSYNT